MDLEDDEIHLQDSTSSLIPQKDYVVPLPTIPVTSALDPRLQVQLLIINFFKNTTFLSD